MRAALSRGRLVETWESVLRGYGAYLGHTRVVAGNSQGFAVVVVTIELERGAADVQVAFDDAGLVAGLFIRPTTTGTTADRPASSRDLTVPTLFHAAAIALALVIAAVFVIVLQRRARVAWRIVALGGLTFIASQLLHVPFNAFVLLPLVRAQPLLVTAIALGLSAAVFEELMRWLVLRTVARTARGWHAALAFGAGHGVTEVVLVALLSIAALVAAVSSTFGAAELYWTSPVGLAFVLPYERALALVLHLSLAVLVMRAVERNDPRYLVAAILWHTTIDAVAVYVVTAAGPIAAEAVLTILTVGSVAIIVALRPPRAAPTPVPSPA